MIGGGILWATAVPVHGHFWTDLAGPFFIAGAGTAFAFIPISIAALAGVGEHEAGLASGLLNTSSRSAARSASRSPRRSRRVTQDARTRGLGPAALDRRVPVGVVGDRRYCTRRDRGDLRARPRDRPRGSSRSYNLTRNRLGGRDETSDGSLHRQARPGRRERGARPGRLCRVGPRSAGRAAVRDVQAPRRRLVRALRGAREDNPLQHVEAFARFQEGIGDRCDEQPVVAQLEEVGSYRLMEEAT